MDDVQKIAEFKRRVAGLSQGDVPDSMAHTYLDDAARMVLERRYSNARFDWHSLPFPERYESFQMRVAVALWARRGAEGEAAHSENGVSRTYESVDAILSEVTPYVGAEAPTW